VIGHLLNVARVTMRTRDPHAPVFEVFLGAGGWLYHQTAGGRITNVSESYASKWNAKRAAYAQAVRVDGSIVRVINPWDE